MSKAKTLATTVSTGGALENPSAIPAANISGAVGSATNIAGGSNGTIPYQSASGTTQMLAVGTNGQVLTSAGAAAPTWATPAATGVTSVAATVPSIFSIAGSPITSTGTLAMTYSGTALPIANGGTGTTSTTFANLTTNVTGTLPIANGGTGTTSTTFANLTTNVTGTLPIANGGTNSTATATAGGVGYGTGSAHAYTSAGTSGQLLQSNGASAPTWTTPSAGAMTFISVQTASGNPSAIEFTSGISATYDDYIVIFENVAFSANTAKLLLFFYKSGAYQEDNYRTNYIYSNASSGQVNNSGETNSFFINTNSTTTGANLRSGTVNLYNLNSTTAYAQSCTWAAQNTGASGTGTDNTLTFGGGTSDTAAAVTRIKFQPNGGTIASGTFRLFGIQKS